MNLSAFKEAGDAVKRIAKDYKPIVELSDSLDEIRKGLDEVGDLKTTRDRLKAETVAVRAEKAKADSELAAVKKLVASEQAVLERVRQAVSAIKTNLSQG